MTDQDDPQKDSSSFAQEATLATKQAAQTFIPAEQFSFSEGVTALQAAQNEVAQAPLAKPETASIPISDARTELASFTAAEYISQEKEVTALAEDQVPAQTSLNVAAEQIPLSDAPIFANQDGAPVPWSMPPISPPMVEYSTPFGAALGAPIYVQPGQVMQPPPPTLPRRKRLNATSIVAICLTIMLILLGAGGLTYDLAYYQPYMARVNATATSNAQATGTINATNAQATSFAATDTAQASATAQAYTDLYRQATSGTPVINDSLKAQGSGEWDDYQASDKSYSCGFKNGSYHVYQGGTGFFLPCYEGSTRFTNFAFQVDMTILNGDNGGIVLRADPSTGKEYVFSMDTSGDYHFYVYLGFKADQSNAILDSTTGSMSSSGPTEITVIARGGTFYFYLNGNFVDSATNTVLTGGLVGVIASAHQQSTQVAYNNAKVWIL